MMKIAKTDEVVRKEIEPVTRISNSLGRKFGYKLSDKKAKTNLLKGAAREALEVIKRQLCIMMFFSTGSFLEVVIPAILEWQNSKRVIESDSSFKMVNTWILL